MLSLLLFFGVAQAQTYHTLQIGQTCSAAVGNMGFLNPHCGYKSAGVNAATVYGISRGTAFSIDRNSEIHIYKVVDVVNIQIPTNLSLLLADTYTFTPVITDAEANTTLTWTSSNPSVATVSNKGVLSAIGEGQTVITCKASNGISALSIVTVKSVLANSVELNVKNSTMNVDESIQLVPTISPDNVTSKAVKWLTSNENIVQVDDDGNITAVAPGYCSIYAIANDGSGKFDKCLVHVTGTNNVKGDINGDGGVTPQDASMILQYVSKKITW